MLKSKNSLLIEYNINSANKRKKKKHNGKKRVGRYILASLIINTQKNQIQKQKLCIKKWTHRMNNKRWTERETERETEKKKENRIEWWSVADNRLAKCSPIKVN